MYNDKDLHTLLLNNGFKTKSKRLDIIKSAKYQLKTEYVFAVCKEILEFQEEGILLRVGIDQNVEPQLMFPYIVMITADNMEADYLAGTHNSTSSKAISRRCCRLCMDTNATEIHLMGVECLNYRSSYLHSSLSYVMHLITINTDLEYRRGLSNGINNDMKEFHKARKQLAKHTKSVSVRPGMSNLLVLIFQFYCFFYVIT